jgi:hypothetical protein
MRKLFSASLSRRKSFLLVLIFQLGLFPFFFSNLNAQVYSGDANLTTQAQVDAFSYTSVTGNLTIYGTSISNLNGLSVLQSVGGVLEITNTWLTNIDELSNLKSIGKDLLMRNNAVSNLNGLSGLTSVGRALYFTGNYALVNFDGLLNLSSTVEGIRISACPMADLNGFSNVNDVTGFIELEDNPNLANVDALQGLNGADIVNSIKINHNPLLQNIDGLLSIKQAGGISIVGNQILPNVDGLSNLESLSSIELSENPALINIDGLSKIKTTTGSLSVRGNSSLTNIDGLNSLTWVGEELRLSSVPNLNGLSNLAKVGTNVIITLNYNLTDLTGLDNLSDVGNDLDIFSNFHLVDFCALTKLFTTGTIGGDVNIHDNGANTVSIPTPQELIIFANQGLCSAVINNATIGTPTVNGCLVPITTTHTDYPAGNVFPVGTTNITWTATDAAGNTATATRTILVVDQQPPTISCPANITVSCASDIPAFDINSVTASDNCSAVVTHVSDDTTNKTCANRFTLTRTYRATDPAGNHTDCSQVITVNDNTPPQITGLSVSQQVLAPPNHKMVDVTVNYSIIDNCVSTPNFSISISSNEPVNGTGDGDTDPDWVIVDDHHIKLRAERAANGSGRIYTIMVTANDGCNAPVSASAQVRVTHNITNPQSGHPFIVGSTVNFNGEFWDKPTNKHTGKWLIDDNTVVKGNVTEPTATKNGTVTGSYKFNTAGVYKLQMNTIDQNNVTSYANTNGDIEEIVVVYDPNGGYTYGGGWFNSQAGAVVSDPSATGKASYGFTMNYFKNSTYPKGETEFEFNIGSLEFDALNFDYLVIDGAKAQFKGSGKITGDQSGYAFIMTVIDGDLDGTGIDKIRMKIYNKTTGKIIYDNQPGASDAANPVAVVGLNSSVTISSNNNSLITRAVPNAEIDEVSTQLEVLAIPNPSNTNFTLKLRSNNTNEKVIARVTDMYGRIIEMKNVNANSIMQIGDRYRPGVYFVKFIQDKQHKEIKLIKLPD